MPLRDHFHSPLADRRHWEGFHGQWPGVIVQDLMRSLPGRYFAEPRVHLGENVEIDVTTFYEEDTPPSSNGHSEDLPDGGATTAVYAPPRPTLAVASDLPNIAAYEIRIFDQRRQCRLVAAVEIVSPANKDRPESRSLFVARCAALLQAGVSVAIVDLVTTRHFNLYAELLTLLGHTDPMMAARPHLVAAACRGVRRGEGWMLETWAEPLAIGRPLPTLPLWLAADFAIALNLEASYERTCADLRIT